MSYLKAIPILYHLSERNLDGQILHPKVPDNFLTKHGFEDNTTPRVCFSTSIAKCLIAFSSNLAGKELYVHKAIDPGKVYQPSLEEVPDCKITGEKWVMRPVKLKKIGKILVIKDDGKPGMKYTYGGKYTAELYGWEYKMI